MSEKEYCLECGAPMYEEEQWKRFATNLYYLIKHKRDRKMPVSRKCPICGGEPHFSSHYDNNPSHWKDGIYLPEEPVSRTCSGCSHFFNKADLYPCRNCKRKYVEDNYDPRESKKGDTVTVDINTKKILKIEKEAVSRTNFCSNCQYLKGVFSCRQQSDFTIGDINAVWCDKHEPKETKITEQDKKDLKEAIGFVLYGIEPKEDSTGDKPPNYKPWMNSNSNKEDNDE
ncbi:MAG: hypothetical protein GY853_00980 [PVC group bacterium]|nr:hypothetical protein [PVC group bacterium]